ncbi:hypothetical protein PV518_37400, partial [Streptomyces sp. ND04-05B]|uniref:hypothetical protein n=1 Tax=Streptomyces sp. ND04-05B TaxID=3028693 RepID=UPI0029B1663B
MRGRRAKERDESNAWKSVARETFRAFDLIMTPALHGHDRQSGAQAAAAHLERGRQLMQPIIDRYIATARTPLDSAWATNRVAP